MEEIIGITVFPSVKERTETSGPSKNSSTTILSPLLPNCLSHIIDLIASTASSRVNAMITPLPRASPSALMTVGIGAVAIYSSALSTLSKTSQAAVGIEYFFINSFEKTLLPSIIAAFARGPKQGIPFSSKASTQPSTSGSSGATTANSILFLTAIFVVWNSNFKKNFREIIGSNTSNQITWNDFFSEEQFAEIENYIYQEHGLRKSEYRVISLGIQPAVSLYNGFYTLDGYSNNYSLEYKHEFYKIMSQELEENNSNYIYFQNWGNRCYLFASDYNGVPNLGKGNFPVYTDFTIDTSQIYEMGGRYIISAGEIVNPQLTGLELCQVFEDLDWYYKIYLYRIIVEE